MFFSCVKHMLTYLVHMEVVDITCLLDKLLDSAGEEAVVLVLLGNSEI